jgi:hypothetical protein
VKHTSCAWPTATASKRWSCANHYGNTVSVSTTSKAAAWAAASSAYTQAGRSKRNLEAGKISSEIYTAQKDIRGAHIPT